MVIDMNNAPEIDELVELMDRRSVYRIFSGSFDSGVEDVDPCAVALYFPMGDRDRRECRWATLGEAHGLRKEGWGLEYFFPN